MANSSKVVAASATYACFIIFVIRIAVSYALRM